MDMPIDDGFAIEQAAFRSIVETQDTTEGIDAFVGKRKPQFVGFVRVVYNPANSSFQTNSKWL